MKSGFFTKYLLLYLIVTVSADVPLSYSVESTGKDCKISKPPAAGSLQKTVNSLPNPFEFFDTSLGTVKSLSDWKCRRAEIQSLLEAYEIGPKPTTAQVKASYNSNKLVVQVSDNGKSLSLSSTLSIPSGAGPHPIIIGMNSGTGSLDRSLFSDFIQVPFVHDQVAKYAMTGVKDTNAAFYQMYPDLKANGDYSAWSWGVSRLIDGIVQVADQLKADTSRIVVTGCSYAGKMALFSGALDERVTLTIAQESGGGGINAWRVADVIGNVEKIANTNYSWFMQALKNNFNNRSNLLPYDHHELVALIAPRPFLALGNPDYEWLGDEAGYVSVMAAYEVWKAMGVGERFGFDFASGHMHCSAASSQTSAVKEYVDKFIRGKGGKQVMSSNKFSSVDLNKWIGDWKGKTISTN